MIKNIFKNLIRNSSKVSLKENGENYTKPNNSEKVHETSKNKLKILKFAEKKFDLSSLDNETKNIFELYEISNLKIKFFENLLKNLKSDKDLRMINLKEKLKNEKSIK